MLQPLNQAFWRLGIETLVGQVHSRTEMHKTERAGHLYWSRMTGLGLFLLTG
jgi:hypothetical protein